MNNLRNLVFYQIFPRQYSLDGTLKAVTNDLERISSLGVDFIYLLPIHPIGEKNRKGSIGSPYSIRDYRKVDSALGTLEDFKELISEAHKHNLKVMIDIVYNHTSRDSHLLDVHPEWFYRNSDNELANRVGEWWDVVDFDYSKDKGLWKELIDILVYWAKLGVDGYRCDVAPLVPQEFWMEANKALKSINPDFVMLSESIHLGFVKYIRDLGFEAMSDSETFQCFDILYDYDIRDEQDNFVQGKASINGWLKEVLRQESIYPSNYVKLRNLDNHDCERVAKYITEEHKLRNIWSLIFFLKGATLVYAGDEALDSNRPSLFEIDKVNWENYNKYHIADLFKKLIAIKKDPIFNNGIFNIHFEEGEVAHISYRSRDGEILEGAFNFSGEEKVLQANVPSGKYQNLIDGKRIIIDDNKLVVALEPIIIKYSI